VSAQTKSAPLRLEKLKGPGKTLSPSIYRPARRELVGALSQPAIV
jgi:hypothetical protein